jgi:hypothetical protein
VEEAGVHDLDYGIIGVIDLSIIAWGLRKIDGWILDWRNGT